jgi:ribosomal protein L29
VEFWIMPPAGNRRERSKVLEREAWRLRAECLSTRAIAARLGVSQPHIIRLLRKTEARVLAESEAIARAVKARQAEQIEHLLSEAIAAWELSKAPPRLVRTKTGGAGRTEETVEVRATAGDVRFLGEARALLDAERKLWGIGAEDDTEARVIDVDSLRASIIEVRRRRESGGGAAG